MDQEYSQPASELDMSDLELLANEKKMQTNSKGSTKSDGAAPAVSTESPQAQLSSTSDPLSTQGITKQKKKTAKRENKNLTIRKEKNDLLFKINSILKHPIHSKKNLSYINLDMDCELCEIKDEYNRIRSALENENGTKMCKHMLLMGIRGIEMANNTFDPLGVDIAGWGDSMSYSMENAEYDDVLCELYAKYKGDSSVAPELKLAMMLASSAAVFALTKKMSNAGGGDTLSKLFENFAPKPTTAQPTPIPAIDTDSDSDTDSAGASKMNGPDSLPDTVNLEDILKTMENNKESPKKKGRPKKKNA